MNIYKALSTEKGREGESTGLPVGSLCMKMCCSARLEPFYSVSFFFTFKKQSLSSGQMLDWKIGLPLLLEGAEQKVLQGMKAQQRSSGVLQASLRNLSKALTPAPHTKLAKALDLQGKALKRAAFKASAIDPSG